MSINIGLMIWKEIKLNDINREKLAETIGITKSKLNTILKSDVIDTELLLKFSVALNTNFFRYFLEDERLQKLNLNQEECDTKDKGVLKNIIAEKNNIIALQTKTIESQQKTIELLESIT